MNPEKKKIKKIESAKKILQFFTFEINPLSKQF